MSVRPRIFLAMVLVVMVVGRCNGHARLNEPPSRATAWRFGFNTPADYNDNESNCGGYAYQHTQNQGRCGICGDPWGGELQQEAGGLYATGTIVRTYTEGQVISAKVDVTSNHLGFFEFRICPNNNPDVEASQTCLNDHPLFAADGSGFRQYIDSSVGIHQFDLKLPDGLACSQCVLQWRYVAGNNWGTCEDGTGALGCGPQEEFRACADVAIKRDGSGQSLTTTSAATPASTQPPAPIATTTTKPSGSGGCKAVGVWQTVPGMNEWCEINCNHVPPFCPSSHCKCD